MARRLSIRARLTLSFVLAIAVILGFAAVALINLVHRSQETQATNQIESAIVQYQARFSTSDFGRHFTILPPSDDVVIQVTNQSMTRVIAASAAIAQEPVLARPIRDFAAPSGYAPVFVHSALTNATIKELSLGRVDTIQTVRGPGYIFGFIYGGAIGHSVGVLIFSVLVSFPLILLMSGGLIWLGIGLALAPVESIRRRVDAIAAVDLTQRVPITGGDDEIARMARTVNAMLERLDAASQFQQEFVSNASHELRSPLTTLLATTERALADPEGTNWPEVADVIVREGRRLDAIIDDLFWLARHDEHHVKTQHAEVDLDDLLYEEASRVRSMSGLAVDTTGVTPTRVLGDPAMLKRMIRNVVDNAMRYAKGELRLACGYEDDQAFVRVADDGEGINVAESARLFERFARADSARSRFSGGTGLGLAIVTEIVLRHGGSARFVEVDHGTLLELRVRRDPASAPQG
ncbi:MAG: HAMP domain-containing protein [Acidobacteriota bacterium]|nr:HAMP domain-containing protein [Acidobacteriota bacterium]